MDYERLERIFKSQAEDGKVQAQPGVWQFTLQNIRVICVADQRHNRMRLLSPILAESDVNDEQRTLLLRANFHTALDARYAFGDGMLFSAFLHPLSTLTDEDLLSAMRQVAALAQNFGGSYSSGELVFPGAQPAPKKDKPIIH